MRVRVRVKECFGLAGKMADGSGPPLPPPSRPDWSGEEEEEEEDEGSGRGAPPFHPRGSRPRARDGAGDGGVRAPLHPTADALSLFHLTPNAITEEE